MYTLGLIIGFVGVAWIIGIILMNPMLDVGASWLAVKTVKLDHTPKTPKELWWTVICPFACIITGTLLVIYN